MQMKVEIIPAVGLGDIIKVGDSINKVLHMLQTNIGTFGRIDVVAPQSQLMKTEVPETDTWLVMQKSGLKLRFDKVTQDLTEIEIYTNPDQNQSKLNFILKG